MAVHFVPLVGLLIISTLSLNFRLTAAAADCRVEGFNTQANFDIYKYMGTWYEIAWHSAVVPIPQESRINDYIMDISYPGNGTAYFAGRGSAQNGIACCFTRGFEMQIGKNPAIGRFIGPYADIAKVTIDYHVVVTDHDNYALVYGCLQLDSDGTCKAANCGIYSRTWTLPSLFDSVIDNAIEELCLKKEDFYYTVFQNDCGKIDVKATCGTQSLTASLMMLLVLPLVWLLICG